MSTLPGPETWRDAGPGPGRPRRRRRGRRRPGVETRPAEPAEYRAATDPLPGAAREADPADVTEQAQSVPPDERDEYRRTRGAPGSAGRVVRPADRLGP